MEEQQGNIPKDTIRSFEKPSNSVLVKYFDFGCLILDKSSIQCPVIKTKNKAIKQPKIYIPYQTNEKAFLIRKIRANFDAFSINEQPHRHEFTELMYIQSGKGKHEVDGVEYNLNENTIYIISKGQVHNFLYAKDIKGILIRFQDSILPAVESQNEGFYHNLLFTLSNHNEFFLKAEDRPLVSLLLDRMLKEYASQATKIIDLSLIQHLLYPLIILLSRYVGTNVNLQDYQKDQYTQFINLLEQSFKHRHDLGFYAQEMGVSKRKLSEICQEKSGKPAKKIINDRVLTESKRLIKYTTLPLKEIANRLGFKDIGYFCRYFKKNTGLTPTVFKTS